MKLNKKVKGAPYKRPLTTTTNQQRQKGLLA